MLENHCSYLGKAQDKEPDLDSRPGSDTAHLWALRFKKKKKVLS